MKTCNSVIFLFFYLFFVHEVYAQSNKSIDSLTKELSISGRKDDTAKVWLLHELSLAYVYRSPDTSFAFANDELLLSETLEYKIGKARSLNDKGNVYWILGNHTNALNSYFEALKISENANHISMISTTYNNIGLIYEDQGEYDKALTYFKKAISYQHLDKSNDYLVEYNNIGEIYYELNMIDSANIYQSHAYQIALRNNDIGHLGRILNDLGNIQYRSKNIDSALSYYSESKKQYLLTTNYHGLNNLSLNIADLFAEIGNIDYQIYYTKQALEYADLGKYFYGSYKSYVSLSKLYKVKNSDSAVKYLQLLITAKDSLFSKEKIKKLQEISIEEKERQQKLEEQKKKAEESRKKKLRLAGIATFIPSFFGVVVLLRKRRIKSKTVEILGLVGLLFFFEFITLLVHPGLEEVTHHDPILMFVSLVLIASVLAPVHHVLEKWVKGKIAH